MSSQPGLCFDQQQRERSAERLPGGALQRAKLSGPAEQAHGALPGVPLSPLDRARQQRADVFLAEDSRVQRPGLRGRLEPELTVDQGAEATVHLQRLVLAAQRVKGQPGRPLRPFAEAIQRRGGAGVSHGVCVVEFGQRRVRGIQARAQHPPLVGAAQILSPHSVRLVLEQFTAHQGQRLLQRVPGHPGRLARRALDQPVETVEVKVDQVGREPVRLRLGDDKLPRPLAVLSEMTPQRRHKGLQRADRILRPLLRPEQVGQAIGRHAMTARGEQDFQHLLRPCAPQVTRTQRSGAVFDCERPEQPDHQAPRLSFPPTRMRCATLTRLSFRFPRHTRRSSPGSVSSWARFITPDTRPHKRVSYVSASAGP